MKSKYGRHGADVEAFLAEVTATTDPGWWNELLAGRDMDARVAADRAVGEARQSASERSAVNHGAVVAYRSLKLTNDRLPNAILGSLDVDNMIDGASMALSLGDRLAPEHRYTMLHRFAEMGFTSVLSSHAWTTAAGPTSAAEPPTAEQE